MNRIRAAAALTAALVATSGSAQRIEPPARATPGGRPLELIPVQGSVYLLAGDVANIAVQIGPEGVLLVDSGSEARADEVVAAIRAHTDAPIRHVVNTHAHLDHIGGNATVRRASRTLPRGDGSADGPDGAAIVAHENVLRTVSESRDVSTDAWPTDAFSTPFDELFFNGEPVRIVHQPNAHTDGDSVVLFRRSDVIATGDLFVTTHYPIFDPEQGGSIDGVLAGLNAIIEWTVPAALQEGGTMVIPGHGRIGDEADVVEYRDMVQIVRDRVAAMIERGMTLEQVQAARPTLDYDARYATDYWPAADFIAAVYASLSR